MSATSTTTSERTARIAAAEQRAALMPWVNSLPEPELLLVGVAIESPRLVAAARQMLAPADFADAFLSLAWCELAAVEPLPGDRAQAHAVALADRLIARHGLDYGCLAKLGIVYARTVDDADPDTFSAHGALRLARMIRRQRLREQLTAAARDLVRDPSAEHTARVAAAGAALEQLDREDDAPTYATTGTTGTALLEASSEPAPDPVVPGLLWPGHVNVLAGASKLGKTFLALAVLRAVATGQRPWPGCPPCPVGRVLLLSRDDTTPEIARRLRLLDPSDLAWAHRITVVGKEQRPATLDGQGLAALERAVAAAQRAGDPFAGVVLDPLALLTPGDINRESDVAPVLEALEHLCLSRGLWVWVLHHVRKMPGDAKAAAAAQVSDDDQAIFDAVRGSASIVQIARAIAVLTKPASHLRRISPRSNLGPARPTELAVCDPGEHEVRYLRPADPAAHHVTMLFGPEEPFSFSDFVRRSDGLPTGSDPSNAAKRRHHAAWDEALRAGAIAPSERVRGNQYYRLTVTTSAVGHHVGHHVGHGADDVGHAGGALKSPPLASGRRDVGYGVGHFDPSDPMPPAPEGTDDLE